VVEFFYDISPKCASSYDARKVDLYASLA